MVKFCLFLKCKELIKQAHKLPRNKPQSLIKLNLMDIMSQNEKMRSAFNGVKWKLLWPQGLAKRFGQVVDQRAHAARHQLA